MQTPFSFGKLVEAPNFTDREAETARLVSNFNAGTNTILISPRRWGKSSLVHKATAQLLLNTPHIRTCAFDLFSVRSEDEFYKVLAEEVVKATHSKAEQIGDTLRKFVSRLIPKLSFSVDNVQDISLAMDWKEVARNPDEILDLAENICTERNLKMLICIDEFQNLGFFKEPLAFQKKLRARWQRHQHVCYCLYGSKRHMMLEVFTKPSMPFYKFGDIIFLEKIALKDWVPFIVSRFADTGKTITEADAQYLATLVDLHPYYVQQLAQLAWFRTYDSCNRTIIDEAFESLLLQMSNLFNLLTDSLANTHLGFLQAMIAGEKKLSSKHVVDHYRLGSTANIARIKRSLEEKEIIDATGRMLEFIDPLYRTWLQKFFFRMQA